MPRGRSAQTHVHPQWQFRSTPPRISLPKMIAYQPYEDSFQRAGVVGRRWIQDEVRESECPQRSGRSKRDASLPTSPWARLHRVRGDAGSSASGTGSAELSPFPQALPCRRGICTRTRSALLAAGPSRDVVLAAPWSLAADRPGQAFACQQVGQRQRRAPRTVPVTGPVACECKARHRSGDLVS